MKMNKVKTLTEEECTRRRRISNFFSILRLSNNIYNMSLDAKILNLLILMNKILLPLTIMIKQVNLISVLPFLKCNSKIFLLKKNSPEL
jgi:hypothetical protein